MKKLILNNQWILVLVISVIAGLAIVLSGCATTASFNPMAPIEAAVEGLDRGIENVLGMDRDYEPFCEYLDEYKLCYVPYASMFPYPKKDAIAQTVAVFFNGEYAHSTIYMQAYRNRKGEMVFDYPSELEHELEHMEAFRTGSEHPDNTVVMVSKR